MLDPTPSSGGWDGSRGSPGFGSRSPASDHIIAMMDRRSSSDARVWVGGDGRVHREATNPPLSVFSVLDTWVWDVAEQRAFDHRQLVSVEAVCRWLDNQLDWICRHEAVADFHEDVRKLLGQLRPASGERSVRVGTCPECDAKLFAPKEGDTIVCMECGERWPRPKWEHLAHSQQREAS